MKKSVLTLTYRNIFQGKKPSSTLWIIKLLVSKANDNSSVVSEIISHASVIGKFHEEEG